MRITTWLKIDHEHCEYTAAAKEQREVSLARAILIRALMDLAVKERRDMALRYLQGRYPYDTQHYIFSIQGVCFLVNIEYWRLMRALRRRRWRGQRMRQLSVFYSNNSSAGFRRGWSAAAKARITGRHRKKYQTGTRKLTP